MERSGTGSTLFDQLEVGAARSVPLRGYVELRDHVLRTTAIAFLVMVLLAPLMTFNELPLTGAGSTYRQIGYILIFAVTMWASRPLTQGLGVIAVPWPMLLAVGWCCLSLIWAVDPDIAFRRLLLTVVVIWTVFLLVRFTGEQTILDILRVALVVALAINYLVVFADPAVGVHLQRDSMMPTALIGNWRGFLVHKNFAGALSAVTILLFLFDAKKLSVALRIAVIVAAAYFLYRTQSKTSGGMGAIALLAGWMFQTLTRRLRAYLIPILMLGVATIGGLTSAYLDVLRNNYVDPSAFTGRGQIWATLVRYASDNLMTGAGFGSFWNIGGNSPVYQYATGYTTQVTVGHNGYLDLLVTVGVPGTVMIVFAAIVWPTWRLLASRRIDPARGALLTTLLLFCFGHNITESSLFERDAIVGVIMLFTVALVQYGTGDLDQWVGKKEAASDVMRTMRRRRREAARAA